MRLMQHFHSDARCTDLSASDTATYSMSDEDQHAPIAELSPMLVPALKDYQVEAKLTLAHVRANAL